MSRRLERLAADAGLTLRVMDGGSKLRLSRDGRPGFADWWPFSKRGTAYHDGSHAYTRTFEGFLAFAVEVLPGPTPPRPKPPTVQPRPNARPPRTYWEAFAEIHRRRS